MSERRDFWDANPMMAGEVDAEPGTAAWFAEFDRLQRDDIYLGDVADVVRPDLRGQRVLEIGCGPGFWARQLAAVGADYVGFDFAPRAVAWARQGQALAGLPGSFLVASAEALPFRDASFDFVVAMGVLQMTPHIERCVAEIHRVLRPGGEGVASVYHRNVLLRGRRRTRLALAAARAVGVNLKGRGRERLTDAPDPDALVSMFDGADNPFARAYTRTEVERLFAGFDTWGFHTTTFPARALPFPVPRPLHRALARTLGFSLQWSFRRANARS